MLLYVAFQREVLQALLLAVEAKYTCLAFEKFLFLLVRCLLDNDLQFFKGLTTFVRANREVISMNSVGVKRSMNDEILLFDRFVVVDVDPLDALKQP